MERWGDRADEQDESNEDSVKGDPVEGKREARKIMWGGVGWVVGTSFFYGYATVVSDLQV